MPLYSETHGGEEVPIYARGPMSHLFSGIHEQSYIAHVIAHASCIGPQTSHCVTKFVESTGVLFRVSNVLSYGAIVAVIKNIMSWIFIVHAKLTIVAMTTLQLYDIPTLAYQSLVRSVEKHLTLKIVS